MNEYDDLYLTDENGYLLTDEFGNAISLFDLEIEVEKAA